MSSWGARRSRAFVSSPTRKALSTRQPNNQEVTVRFWGVRGSIPVPGPGTVRGGGNTACVEIRCANHVLLFDAGSGLRVAGAALSAEGLRNFDLFLSHSHYDHLIGLPFFVPLMSAETRFTLWSGHLRAGPSTRDMILSFLRAPFFPVCPDVFPALTSYRDFQPGDVLTLGNGVVLRTASLNHPGGATGYRVEYQGRAIAYMTDTEPTENVIDSRIRELAAGADLVIYDCMYTQDEFRAHPGYGHSTWQHGVELCVSAGARRLAMFHHAPGRDDEALDRLEQDAKQAFSGAFAAREGMTINL